MRLLKTFGFALTIALGVSSCVINFDDDSFVNCINGRGPKVSQELFLPPREGIDLRISGDVLISQGDQQQIIVEGSENIIDALDLDCSRWYLEIDVNGCIRNADNLRFFITLPRVEYLSIAGSGSIVSDNFLITDDIDLFISGSGDMDLGLDADDIRSRISGSGTILIEGIADETDLEISGSGDYRMFGLESNQSRIEIRGSGDAEVFVRDELNIIITGSGDVLYRGNPELNISIQGSGDVINAN